MKKGLIAYNLIFLAINIFWFVISYRSGFYKLFGSEGVLIGFILSNILHIVWSGK